MFKQLFEKWYNALTKPKETFKKEKENASFSEAVKHIGLAGLIAGLIEIFVLLLGFTRISFLSTFNAIILIIVLPPLLSILTIIFLLISSGIFYIPARIIGGKEKYKTQTYIFSLFLAPLIVIMVFVSEIPYIGNIANLALQIYAIYLFVIALRETHDFSTKKAIAAWITTMIIMVLLFVLTSIMMPISSLFR